MLPRDPIPSRLAIPALAIGLLAGLFASPAEAQIPAFPGAEGFGAYAAGGRGGDVYIVTNLNSSGAGSLAEGIASAPTSGRTIVFAVSGYIHVPGSNLRITKSKITIAGQTAPGDGVGLKDGTFRISGDDIVIRHLRFRHGKEGSGGDCIDLDSGSLNCVLDHISMQFSTDENISSFSSPPENLTMQWSLNAWGLESHSCGGLWDQNHATCHHSLWAHNHTRNPKARPGGLLEWVNNVTFDWDIGFIMGDSETPASWKANVRNSYFLCPPGNLRSRALEKANLDRNGVPNFSLYLNNCRHDNDGDGLLNGTDKGYGIASGSYTTLGAPVAATGAVPVTLDDPTVALKKIVSSAGALRLNVAYAGPVRDEVDTRLIQNLVTQTANHITRESALGLTNAGFGTLNSSAAPADTDKDGMPDFYETALGWNVAAQDHNTALPNSSGVLTGTTYFPASTVSGYTRLEEYLFYKSVPHGTVAKNVAGSPTSVTVDLRKYTSGFSSSPTFAVANVTGGSVVLSGTGNALATFTPTVNYTGRARFDFTVTDAAGHTSTQTCALVVTTSGLPRDLVWKGDGAQNWWDFTTTNWLLNGVAVACAVGDRVTLDDNGSQAPAIAVQGTQAVPGGLSVNAAGNFTINGGIVGSGSALLTKRGPGAVTFQNGPVSFPGGATLDEGTLSFASSGSFDAPSIDLNAGTLISAVNLSSALAVNGTATLSLSGTREHTGALTGAGTLFVGIGGSNTFTLRGNTTAFAGTVNLGASTGFWRFYGALGSAAATFDLGTGSADLINRDGNATIDLGALAGGPNTSLSGSSATTNPTIYRIGATGNATTFAGSIANGGGGGLTRIEKVGSGVLTLSGPSSYTGTTTVSTGELVLNGSLGNTATTVATGAKLRGQGSLGGSLTLQSGAEIAPGASTTAAGIFTTGAGLNLQGATLSLQLSNSPAGSNDRLAMTGGTLALSGTNPLSFSLTDGALGAGTYDLITGGTATTGSVANFTHNLPTDARQTFALSTATPGKVQLLVTGNPATVAWKGNVNGTWDVNATANWLNGASGDTFRNFDAVTIDDSATATTLTPAGSVRPRSTAVSNPAKAFTIAAGLDGTGALTKSGAGLLNLSGANAYTGGTILNAGSLTLTTATANASGLGTGPVALNGGTLSMFSAGDGTHAGVLPNALQVNGTSTFQVAPRCGFSGAVSGTGTLNYYTPFVRADITGDWSAFTGQINVTTDAGGGDFRIAASYAWPGLPQASVHLTDKTYFYHSGILNAGAGTTIEVGALSGTSGSHLRGGVTSGRALTYRIGSKNTDTTFAGDFLEQNTGTTTALVKTGTGTWTLAGACGYRGSTTVEAGTLRFTSTGSLTNDSPLQVKPGAALTLDGGTLSVDSVTLENGATMTSTGGNIAGDFNNDGTVTVGSGALTIAGDVVNTGTMRITSGAALVTSGTFVNSGTLDLLTSASALPANMENEGVIIENLDRRILSSSRSGTHFSVTVRGYVAHVYQLQRAAGLTGPWTDVGAPKAGTGAIFTLDDLTGATGFTGFYRVKVSP